VPSNPSNLLQNVAKPNQKLPGGECHLAKVAEIRTGRFGSRPFGNLEKTRSGRRGRHRENCFSASVLIQFISSASFGSSRIVWSSGRRLIWDRPINPHDSVPSFVVRIAN